MYYIGGTIDAIEISGEEPGRIRFSLMPVSGNLLVRDGGKKKVLFTDSSSPSAMMVDPGKNATGKEIVWFHADNYLLHPLMSAKSNRNAIWVWCDNPEDPDRDAKEPIPPISTFKAFGIRVFGMTGGRSVGYNEYQGEATNDKELSESDKIKLKFDAIWKARDSELVAIRERALLAWGFLMFCYGGYGCLAYEALTIHEFFAPHFSACNLALLFLSIICLRLSVYWVQIAKGAKSWAENMDFIAEGFLHRFAKNDHSYVRCPFSTASGRAGSNISPIVFTHKNCENCKGDPSYACVFSVIDPKSKYYCDSDENILTTKGGAFSPSAVVVSIARLSMFISMALCLIHGSVLVVGKDGVKNFLVHDGKGFTEWLFPVFLVVVFLIMPFAGFALRRLLFFLKNLGANKGATHNQRKSLLFRGLTDPIMYSGNVSMGLHDNQTVRNSVEDASIK